MENTAKIKDLVKNMGGSPEMADSLIEELDKYVQQKEKSINEEFHKRLTHAKQACIEEVEKYKEELARKVEIYFEARGESITREMKKQAAIGESGASKTLQDIRSLIEGTQMEQSDPQAAAENKKLRTKVSVLEQKNAQLDKKSKDAFDLAKKLLEHNKRLSSKKEEMQESKKVEPTRLIKEETATPKTSREAAPETLPIKKTEEETIMGDEDIADIAATVDPEAVRPSQV